MTPLKETQQLGTSTLQNQKTNWKPSKNFDFKIEEDSGILLKLSKRHD